MNFIDKLNDELDNCLNWFGIDLEEYIKNEKDIDGSLYINRCYLILVCMDAINNSKEQDINNELIDKVLTVLSLDNETEDLLHYLELVTNQNILEKIIARGCTSELFHARWQIAELINRTKNNEFLKYIDILLKDKDEYVERRALLSLSRMDSEKAIEECNKRVNRSEEKLRNVAIGIIEEISTNSLDMDL